MDRLPPIAHNKGARRNEIHVRTQICNAASGPEPDPVPCRLHERRRPGGNHRRSRRPVRRHRGAHRHPGSVDKTSGQAFNWQTEAQKVEQSINQLSEVSESRVTISGNTALVGVKFDAAYQGEMTDRIREMISGLVKQADPNIQVVAVTATEEDVNKIFDISDRVRGGGAFEDFKDDIVGIVRNITTLR